MSMNKGPMGPYPKSWLSGGRKALNTAIMASLLPYKAPSNALYPPLLRWRKASKSKIDGLRSVFDGFSRFIDSTCLALLNSRKFTSCKQFSYIFSLTSNYLFSLNSDKVWFGELCLGMLPHSSLVTQVTKTDCKWMGESGNIPRYPSPVHAPGTLAPKTAKTAMALADSPVDAVEAPYSQSGMDWLRVFNSKLTANTAVILDIWCDKNWKFNGFAPITISEIQYVFLPLKKRRVLHPGVPSTNLAPATMNWSSTPGLSSKVSDLKIHFPRCIMHL